MAQTPEEYSFRISVDVLCTSLLRAAVISSSAGSAIGDLYKLWVDTLPSTPGSHIGEAYQITGTTRDVSMLSMRKLYRVLGGDLLRDILQI